MSRAPKTNARRPEAAAPRLNADASHWCKRDWIFGLILVFATVIAYHPAWHAGFIWDDDNYVTGNTLLSAPDGLRRIWFSFDAPSQYFPLTYTVFRLEYALWGLNSTGYHLVNILLHAVNALLVWRLLRRLDLPGAWLGAAIWALHPVQVESVAWTSELKNVLMCFFFLLTLLAWIGFVGEESWRRWNFYALALAFFALALFSKTTACTLPAALLLILWLKGRPINRQRLAQTIPFIALGIGMGLLTMWCERYHMGTQGELFAMGMMDRILLASRAVWFYIGELFWPVNLMFCYPRWTISAYDPLAYLWLVATVGFGAIIYYTRGYVGQSVGIAVLFFILTLTPVLGFVMQCTFLWSFVADHYQYVASLGPIALTTAGITAAFGLLGKRKPLLKPVFYGALLLSLGVLTWRQCEMYADMETLWRVTIDRNPAAWMAHNNLGEILLQKGDVDDAIIHFQKALQIKPDDSEACNNLGNTLLQEGQTDEAIMHFQQALAIEQQALSIQPDYYAQTHYNLGNALLQKGQADDAILHYQTALAIQPDFVEAHYNLGNALLQKGQTDEAILHYQTAISIKPDYFDAHNNLGTALFQKGKVAEAIAQYQAAVNLQPDNAKTHNNLAWVLATCPQASLRNGKKAVELAQRANQLTGDGNPAFLDTLAAAYAEAGRFPEAVDTAQRALRLAETQSNTALAEAIRYQMKLYAAGLPFHQQSK